MIIKLVCLLQLLQELLLYECKHKACTPELKMLFNMPFFCILTVVSGGLADGSRSGEVSEVTHQKVGMFEVLFS